jgi:thioredoxin reductase
VSDAGVGGSEGDVYDVAVVGGGPAGLSATLNLVRARRTTLLLDSNRPRNAATLHSHGFLTRDGIPPLELRRLGREEIATYPHATIASARVDAIRRLDDGTFAIEARGVRGEPDVSARARAVLIATGLHERLPALPNIRAFYGTALHSCIECDGYEKSGRALALIGESDDLAARALELTRFTDDLVVFTCGVGEISESEERALTARGIHVERREVADIEHVQSTMTGVRLADGEVIARDAGFVRPIWTPMVEFVEGLGVERDERGLVRVDADGRTSVAGVYAAGDTTAPGPQQLIVAAGEGAHTAAAINRDLIGGLGA